MQAPTSVHFAATIRPSAVPAEMFAPPSAEALRLLRWLPDLVSPQDGRGSLLSRFVRMGMVAPFTQMTLISFDLQAFLFEVFHRRFVSRFGHGLFMTTCNFFAMLLLAQFSLASSGPAGDLIGLAPNGAWVYAALLLVWYAAAAASVRLWAWFALMVPIVATLAALATWTFAVWHVPQTAWGAPLPLWCNPWLGMVASAFLIAASHAPEERLPPRAADPLRWLSIRAYVLAPELTPAVRALRALRVGGFVVWGTLDEWWASPRLMAYNYLMLMMQAGYAPERYQQLQDWVRRALASGNPALDYVGTGGGTFLRLADAGAAQESP